jgi:hypothetical protein
MKQQNTLPELLRHAAELAEKGESLKDKFEVLIDGTNEWMLVKHDQPGFFNAKWRIADKKPPTFEMKVGNKVFILNKPYMSVTSLMTKYWHVNSCRLVDWDVYCGRAIDLYRLNTYNCWRTEADAKAYAEAKLARDKFEIGEIK